jgi:hypothetical protein
MDVLVVIAGWTFGSILLGLVLGQILRPSAERRRIEEEFLASPEAGTRKTTCPGVDVPKAAEAARDPQDGLRRIRGSLSLV